MTSQENLHFKIQINGKIISSNKHQQIQIKQIFQLQFLEIKWIWIQDKFLYEKKKKLILFSQLETAEKWCETNGANCYHFETSAKDSINIEQAFLVIAQKGNGKTTNEIDYSFTLEETKPKKNQDEINGCC